MRKYRATIIGTGDIADRHMIAYRELGNIEIVAVSDTHPDKLLNFAQKWQILNRYDNWRDLLSAELPELLSVCTWENSHAEIVVAAANARVSGILCEKPMAINLAEADEMILACKANETILAVGHMRRYNPHYVEARRLIHEGVIGQVERMWAYMGGWDMFLWGSHYADMLHYLNKDVSVRWVMGQIDWSQRGMSYPYSQYYLERRGDMFIAEDNAVALIEFDNDVQVVWESGSHSPLRWKSSDDIYSGRTEIRVYGTEGEIRVSDGYIAFQSKGTSKWARLSYMKPQSQKQFMDAQFIAEIRELVECVENSSEHQLSGHRGRRALELLLAIYESARRRALVKLPLNIFDNPLIEMMGSEILG